VGKKARSSHTESQGKDPADESNPSIEDDAQNSYARERGGLGIGLALVKQLVELHGGSVHAHSVGLERGSEFTIRLPLAAEGSANLIAPVPKEPAAVPAEIPPLRVLVVDDNVDGAESLGRLLRGYGHEVRVAYRGVEALEIAGEFKPRLVLLDVAMPVMDGFEVARRFRQRHGLATLTLVALSGYGQEADRARTRDAGFDEHMVKPANIAELERVLQRAANAS
jgi:CheY-like chemotaxis protein